MASDREFSYVETINDPEMLNHLDFAEDRVEVIVSGLSLNHMPFKSERFVEDDEYWSIVDQIKASGYDSAQPIHVRPGRQGSWIVDLDDASRFMAAKRVATDFFANLLTQKVSKVQFILHDASMDGNHKAPKFSFGQGA